MILLEKLKILTPLQKLPKNVGDLGKLIVAKGSKKLPNMVTLLAAHDSNPKHNIYLHLFNLHLNWHLKRSKINKKR